MRLLVHSAHCAHLNLLEQFLPFAVWVMLAHEAGMINGMAGFPLRPLLFTASRRCTLAIAVAIFAQA
jgi:uncharacterized MAPEG superfamily protein